MPGAELASMSFWMCCIVLLRNLEVMAVSSAMISEKPECRLKIRFSVGAKPASSLALFDMVMHGPPVL